MTVEICGVVRISPEGHPRFRASDMGINVFTIKPGDMLLLTSGAKVSLVAPDMSEIYGYPVGRLHESASLPGLPRMEAGDQLIFHWCEVCGVFLPERPTVASPSPYGADLTINLIEPPATAPDLLGQAEKHMRDRAATYDKPEGERSMASTVKAFNAITGRELKEADGWLLLSLLKFVRDNQRQQPHRDSVEDAIAYAALYGEARLQEGGVA